MFVRAVVLALLRKCVKKSGCDSVPRKSTRSTFRSTEASVGPKTSPLVGGASVHCRSRAKQFALASMHRVSQNFFYDQQTVPEGWQTTVWTLPMSVYSRIVYHASSSKCGWSLGQLKVDRASGMSGKKGGRHGEEGVCSRAGRE